MKLSDFLDESAVIDGLSVNSKKQLLQELGRFGAGMLMDSSVSEHDVFETLLERERLGTTGIGEGVAIPHGKLEKISGLKGAFVRLNAPIDFEAVDDNPIDLVFLLLAPIAAGADHLKALALISRLLRDQELCAKLREARKSSDIYSILIQNNSIAA